MDFLINLLKPAPEIAQIKDPERVSKEYKYWRLRIFYAMFIGYVCFYLTRKSFTFIMPTLMVDLGLNKAQLGLLGTILYLSYAMSKFVSGVMSDQSNPRFFMAFGLIITGLANILFGASSSLLLFCLFWGINGWFQGWGWPPCARLLTHWYSQSERGSWWSIWSTSHNVGGFLIPLLAGVIAMHFGWRFAMFVPGIVCILMGCFLINRLRDTPQSLGLPPIEAWRKDSATLAPTTAERELTTKEILFTYVLRNKWLWLLAFASLFVYVIRSAINDWTAIYLIETKGYTILQGNACASSFEIGGVVGMLVAGWLSDKFSEGKRGPMNVLFSFGMLLSVFALWMHTTQSFFTDAMIVFGLGFFLFGPQMMIGLAAAELSHKKAAGTASGFAGCFAYFGSALSGFPLGAISHSHGWNIFFVILAVCSTICVLIFLPMWNAKAKPAPLQEELAPAE